MFSLPQNLYENSNDFNTERTVTLASQESTKELAQTVLHRSQEQNKLYPYFEANELEIFEVIERVFEQANFDKPSNDIVINLHGKDIPVNTNKEFIPGPPPELKFCIQAQGLEQIDINTTNYYLDTNKVGTLDHQHPLAFWHIEQADKKIEFMMIRARDRNARSDLKIQHNLYSLNDGIPKNYATDTTEFLYVAPTEPITELTQTLAKEERAVVPTELPKKGFVFASTILNPQNNILQIYAEQETEHRKTHMYTLADLYNKASIPITMERQDLVTYLPSEDSFETMTTGISQIGEKLYDVTTHSHHSPRIPLTNTSISLLDRSTSDMFGLDVEIIHAQQNTWDIISFGFYNQEQDEIGPKYKEFTRFEVILIPENTPEDELIQMLQNTISISRQFGLKFGPDPKIEDPMEPLQNLLSGTETTVSMRSFSANGTRATIDYLGEQ